MIKLGLGMIVKDEVEQLERILSTYSKLFDEIQITITNQAKKDELYKLVEYYGGTASYFEWIKDFAAARNFNMSQFKNSEYYLRLDCDDEIIKSDNLRSFAEYAKSNNISIVYCYYDYSKDRYGVTNAAHHRETLIKLDDNLYWNKTIHENLLPKTRTGFKIYFDEKQDLVINHLITPEHADLSGIRNLEYLKAEWEKDKENTDPRTLGYLGRTLISLGDYKGGRYFLEKHIEKSGWDEDRYLSWIYLATSFLFQKQYKDAIAACFEAVQELPSYPDAYLTLHDIYCDMGEYEKAIDWGKEGLRRKMPKTFILLDPSKYTWRPQMSMAFCYYQVGEYDIACKLLDEARKLAPECEFIKEFGQDFNDAKAGADFVKHFLHLYGYLRKYDDSKVTALLSAVPDKLQEHSSIAKVRYLYTPPKVWEEDTITIFCAPVLEPWGPPSVAGGIGGSEEAVIYLSKALVKQGYRVTVYNECGPYEGIYDGVEYIPFYKLNPRDCFNLLISWRFNLFTSMFQARQKWVWMHDIPGSMFGHKRDIVNVDKIIVLSDFHKSLLPSFIPNDKILVSANGINLPDYVDPGLDRNTTRIIYGSSYDRGLEHLLRMWPKIKQEVPTATVEIFYGWNNYLKMLDDPKKVAIMKYIKGLMDQPGVTEHGRIGHKELIKEYYKAGVWAYPCDFQEISCITAMKAQACGAVPVSTNFAALNETVKYGVIIDGKGGEPETDSKFCTELIRILKDTKEQERLRLQMVGCQQQFSWDRVAEQWVRTLKQSLNPKQLVLV